MNIVGKSAIGVFSIFKQRSVFENCGAERGGKSNIIPYLTTITQYTSMSLCNCLYD